MMASKFSVVSILLSNFVEAVDKRPKDIDLRIDLRGFADFLRRRRSADELVASGTAKVSRD